MPKHFHRELEKLKKRILSLGAMVEERVYMATKAIENRDSNLADKIIKSDYEIDEMEVDVEEECLKILALYQPVAVDLRFITAVIKINNDLERIADEAVNIARGIQYISKGKKLHFDFDFYSMAEKTEAMLKKSLDALVNMDVDLAFKVCLLDDEVDKINAKAHRMVKDAIKDNPDQGEYFINLLLISRHLERIADHATNIAEEVIYLIEGEIIRHRDF
ncbi:MAG: phosphate signaling complex protein PhoU [Deltaproteobacteria bacterium]|nr:phosphate signaling complex protein PhoU [Deltaproteobacteria bacterium]MBW2013462.1 phosphate signaling complex protein PhoU [Deltaproteobacteria bacterium]MBW2090173.1 phosphate signaling complex protein PhoU [Deltaproteobacteria bacterium]MBW2321458.1 phosphate signaling complex protein PhoU [Deltaproteobacteria bacterium]OQY12702.1 MAG: phosphate transport system regulatory protein PhoU [Desulfobacteraceae bacterium 4572_187]